MFKSLYISRFFFIAYGVIVGLFVISYGLGFMFYIAQVALLALLGFTILDVLILFAQKKAITAERIVDERLNLGDASNIQLKIKSNSLQPFHVKVYDVKPLELQDRTSEWHALLGPKGEKTFSYSFTPTKRGEYEFGKIHVFINSIFFLVKRRIIADTTKTVNVYPSVLQMKQYELKVFNHQTLIKGIKKIRRLGHNNEFEQIKNYVQGDDIRTINWKATSRRSGNELMVNQYQDERSQSIFTIIDKSRSMQQDFNDMTLLDYAINSTLVFSNIALRKGDKVGLLTFSDKMGSKLPADKSSGHLRRIIETLYNQKTKFLEADYGMLYQATRRYVRGRSMIMLYTNFETEQAMKRALPMLKRISQNHLLVVVFFENTKLDEVAILEPETVRDIYVASVAEKVANVKRKIALELNRAGIQTILTKPEDLSINTINKYLELKSKGLI